MKCEMTAALAALLVAGLAGIALAQPQAEKVTPALIEAARKEGTVVFYSSADIVVGERVGKAFEAAYPGVKVKVERNGSERLFQKFQQELAARIAIADVISTSDAAHFVIWKRDGVLAPYLPEEAAAQIPTEYRDKDAAYLPWRLSLSVMGYNTKLVKPEDAPKSLVDLLDPKWSGKIVKAHPSYSGTILTATFQITRELGWDYYEKLAKQKVMQVQSSTEPPKKLSLGERAIMAEGNEYTALLAKSQGNPIEVIYPREGSPTIVSPSAVVKNAPHPNAARLFQSFLFARESQQALVDEMFMRSFHRGVKEPAGRPSLANVKAMKEDAEAVVEQVETIKERYRRHFGT
jgi:iron(III) transport system substrate-binding protein